jgi:pimeloyl-ACP methyl ester carboxylesterase
VFPPRAFAYLSWLARSRLAMAMLAKTMRAMPRLARLPLAYGRLARTRIPDDVLAGWLAPGANDAGVRRDVAKFIRGIDPAQTIEAAERLRGFRKPALLVWSREDPLFPLELAHRLVERLPDARLETVDTRVFVPEDEPALLARLVRDFIAASAPARARA